MRRHRIALLSLTAVVMIALLGLAAFAWIISGALVYSPQSQRTGECGREETEPCEDAVFAELQIAPVAFEVAASDGTSIAGLHLPSHNGATILMTTGFGGGRVYELPAASMLNDHGFGILLVDFRGRGASGGDWVTLGRDDVGDLSTVLDYAITNLDVDPEHIGALGPSYGGAMAILLAASDKRVKAVIADSPYDALNADTLSAFIDQPAPIPWMVVALLELRLDVDLDRVAPLERIGDISPRAVFIMDAGSDSVIAPGSGKRLHAAAGQPKRLWHEPGLDHTAFRFEMPEAFEANVISFFEEHLLAPDERGGE